MSAETRNRSLSPVPCLPIFTGFEAINGYAGSMTFKCATAKENGELIFEDL